MREDPIGRSFQWIHGEAAPADRAETMERDLRSQGLSTTPPAHESLQERHVPWGRRAPRGSVAIQRGGRLSQYRLSQRLVRGVSDGQPVEGDPLVAN
jgi:hypothetical protein